MIRKLEMRTRMVQKFSLGFRSGRMGQVCLYGLLLFVVAGGMTSEFVLAASTNTQAHRNNVKRERKTVGRAPARNSQIPSGPQTTGLKRLTASGLYDKARDYFAAARYADAIKYGAAAQRRTSASRLPTVLVARSYYRLGNVARASKLFLTVPLAEIPKDAAIEYLLTMFAAGRYADVIKSFAIIPDNHPYRDVAKFYLGSAFLQLKLYQKSSVALRSAKKLPASLLAERRQLLSYIKELRAAESRGQFAETPQYYNYGPVGYVAPPVDVGSGAPVLPGGVPSKAPLAKAPPPKQGFKFLATPRFTLNIKSTKDDFNGYDLKQTDQQTPTLSVDLGVKYLGKPTTFGGQPSLDLIIAPSQATSDTKITTSKLAADAADPSNVQNVTTRSESRSDSFTQKISLVGLLPLSEPIDVVASFLQTDKSTKSQSKTEVSTTLFTGKLSADFDPIDFSAEHAVESAKTKGVAGKSESSTSTLRASYSGDESTTSLAATMTEFKPSSSGIRSETNLEISWARPLQDFSLELTGTKSDSAREPLTAQNTVLSQTAIKGELGYSLGVGLSVTLSAAYSQLEKIPIFKDDSVVEGPDEVFANGVATQYVLLVKYAPVSFASASVSYDYTDRKLGVADENFKMKLLKSNWSQKTISAINVGLNYTF